MVCPKGHESEDLDFCSVCGAKMALAAGGVVGDTAGEKCPDCGATRHPADTVFCEDCGFNFATCVHGAGAHAEKKPEALFEAVPAVLAEWEVSVSVDPSLRTAESPEPPADFQASTLLLLGESYLIGRKSEKRSLFPEISLDADDAVSHRHALLTRTADGGLTVKDAGSSNGTRLNGAELVPQTETALKDGDEITVGHWTKITVRRVG
jgi:hypothetical protein